MDETRLRALDLHARFPVVDTHSHFLINGHYLGKNFAKRHRPPWLWNPLRNVLDLPRLREGRISCPTFTVYVPIPPFRLSAWKACLRILATLDRVVEQNAEVVTKVTLAREVRQVHAQGKLAALTAVEGGHVIGKKVERLATLRERGVRLFTLTHFYANRICDAAWGPQVHKGLSEMGREVIKSCNRLGMVVDLAHCSEKAFYQALELCEKPPMVTHTGLRMGRKGQRNLSDDQVKALAARGGALGIILWPWYLKPHNIFGGLELVSDSYAHVAELVGTRHLMIGTDMDGYTWMPRGFRDASDLPAITERLLQRGFGESEIGDILGGNALRIIEAWES